MFSRRAALIETLRLWHQGYGRSVKKQMAHRNRELIRCSQDTRQFNMDEQMVMNPRNGHLAREIETKLTHSEI